MLPDQRVPRHDGGGSDRAFPAGGGWALRQSPAFTVEWRASWCRKVAQPDCVSERDSMLFGLPWRLLGESGGVVIGRRLLRVASGTSRGSPRGTPGLSVLSTAPFRRNPARREGAFRDGACYRPGSAHRAVAPRSIRAPESEVDGDGARHLTAMTQSASSGRRSATSSTIWSTKRLGAAEGGSHPRSTFPFCERRDSPERRAPDREGPGLGTFPFVRISMASI